MIEIKKFEDYNLEATKDKGFVIKESVAVANKVSLIELASNEVLTMILHDLNAIIIQSTMQGKIPLDKGRAYCECIADIERIIFMSSQYVNKK